MPGRLLVAGDFCFHYAWGGRLCLHPFNLGFRFRAVTETEVLYSKLRFVFGRKATGPNRDLNGSGDTPPPHAQWRKNIPRLTAGY